MSKYGRQNGNQRYKCGVCKRVFQGGNRIGNEALWIAYTVGKQTYVQLAKLYGCSARTIQRRIDNYVPGRNSNFENVANVLMDTTYFGRKFGVMVFKDSLSNKILYKRYVKYETNQLYLEGIREIARRGINIQSIVCDGRRGLFQIFSNIPVQMCQFHQVQIIKRYLTRRPKIPAAIELQQLTLTLTKTDKVSFLRQMYQWKDRWNDYLNERTTNIETGKSFYTHKRLRSAWLSLKRNLQWLFVFEENRELMMHNTTNALDGIFADLKNKLRCHNGLSTARKKKFIDGFFEA